MPPRLRTLETLGNKELTREIIPLLENNSYLTNDNHSSSSIDALEELLSSPDEWVCALTIQLISELDLRNFISKLRELKSDHESLAAQSARDALI